MKRVQLFIIAVSMLLTAGSCKLDNYDAPDSALYGAVIDAQTNELVEQDIINGTQIEYVEQGFSNPVNQYMVIKNDGNYQNKLVFGGSYDIRLVRGNCVPTDTQHIQVKGNTKLDFKVQPYIRIKGLSIQKSGTKIVATFTLDQTVPDNIKTIGLYAHPDQVVGQPVNIVAAEQALNIVSDGKTTFRLEIDLAANVTKLISGKPYFFRVGALINVAEAKPNYAPAVRITI